MILLTSLLLQSGTSADPEPIGLFRFFAAFCLILIIYTGALAFTYWISKDE